MLGSSMLVFVLCAFLRAYVLEMSFGKIKPINILVDNSTAIAFAKCATKRSKLRHIDCRQRWYKPLSERAQPTSTQSKYSKMGQCHTALLSSHQLLRNHNHKH